MACLLQSRNRRLPPDLSPCTRRMGKSPRFPHALHACRLEVQDHATSPHEKERDEVWRF